MKRTLNYLSYMGAAIVAAPFLPKMDIVISTSPQFFNGLAGYLVSRFKRAPWVLEIRDLWPESIIAVGAISNRIVIQALEWLENFAYRAADQIVPVTDAFQRHMESRGIPSLKIAVIKNGADLSLYKPAPGKNPVTEELGLEGKFVAAYFGTHGMAHHLETILHAAERLQHCSDIVFLLAGDGAERERVLRLRDKLDLTNVIMLPQQPKERMPWLWACCDVSLILLKKSDLFKTVIPSKLFESMAMEKPIILGVEGESAEILQSAKAGFCIEPENDEELAARVLELRSNPTLCQTYGLNARAHVLGNYDRSHLAKRYEILLQSLRDKMQKNTESLQRG